jgi:hypothetical protein
MNEENVQTAKREAAKKLLGPNYPNNVIGVGIGNKLTEGKDTGELCVRVYVLSKFEEDKLSPSALVPRAFHDVPTDVIKVGWFGRHGRLKELPTRPPTIGPGSHIRVEANVPNVNSGAFGTLGSVVSDGGGNDYILSCNHILGANGRVPENRNIFSNDKLIGSFGGSQFCVELKRGQINYVDCALGRLTNKKVSFDFPVEFQPASNQPITPRRGMRVAKAGAISGTTYGTIDDVDAEGYINYEFGTFHLDNQVVIDSGSDDIEFAVSGDSGSWVVDIDQKAATAMIFAAAGRFAVACPLPAVMKALQDQLNSRLTLRIGEGSSRGHASGK